jgi:hypothetical protein
MEQRPVEFTICKRVDNPAYKPDEERKSIANPLTPKRGTVTTHMIKIYADIVGTGVLLEWGSEADEGGSNSVGIVETKGGKIITAYPENIRFTDK